MSPALRTESSSELLAESLKTTKHENNEAGLLAAHEAIPATAPMIDAL